MEQLKINSSPAGPGVFAGYLNVWDLDFVCEAKQFHLAARFPHATPPPFHPFCDIQAFSVLFCRVRLSDKSRKRADTLKNHSLTAGTAPPEEAQSTSGPRPKEEYETSRFMGVIFITRDDSATTDCALKPLCFVGTARTCFCVTGKVFYLFLFSALVYFACRGRMFPQRLKVNAGGESAAAEARRAAETRPSR